jgi:hypothetical protein
MSVKDTTTESIKIEYSGGLSITIRGDVEGKVMKNTKRQEKLMDRTCKLINSGRYIVLKKVPGKDEAEFSPSYLHQWTMIQAGPDDAQWTDDVSLAMDIFSLEWAFAIAPLYGCKVYSVKRKR